MQLHPDLTSSILSPGINTTIQDLIGDRRTRVPQNTLSLSVAKAISDHWCPDIAVQLVYMDKIYSLHPAGAVEQQRKNHCS